MRKDLFIYSNARICFFLFADAEIESFPEPPDNWKKPSTKKSCVSSTSSTLPPKTTLWNFDNVYDRDIRSILERNKNSNCRRLSLTTISDLQDEKTENRTFTLPRIKKVYFQNVDKIESVSTKEPSNQRTQSISSQFKRKIENFKKSS